MSETSIRWCEGTPTRNIVDQHFGHCSHGIRVDANPKNLFKIEPIIRVVDIIYVFFKITLRNDEELKNYGVDYRALRLLDKEHAHERPLSCYCFVEFFDEHYRLEQYPHQLYDIIYEMEDIIFKDMVQEFYRIEGDALWKREKYLHRYTFDNVRKYKFDLKFNPSLAEDPMLKLILQEDLDYARLLANKYTSRLNSLKKEIPKFVKSYIPPIEKARRWLKTLNSKFIEY